MQVQHKHSAQAEPARPLRIMVSVGEASGDLHAAPVIRSILNRHPDAEIFGMGGTALRNAGMNTIVDSETSASVMGLTEVFGSLGKIIAAFRKLVEAAKTRPPDVVVLVDFPDFNLRLAKAVSKHCPNIVYFISPQLWAWRTGRIKTVRKYVSRVIPIFPFEEAFYAHHGVTAKFVGHPIMDRPAVAVDRDLWLKSLGLDPAAPVVALLPGSRRAEVTRHAPVMCEAVKLLQRNHPQVQPIVAVASVLERAWVLEQFSALPSARFADGAPELLHVADAAVVASGTATMEAALAKIPFVVIYKLSGLTYVVGKFLIRGVKHIAMPNLVMGEEVVRELIQDEAKAETIAEELECLLQDREYAKAMQDCLAEVSRRLEYSPKVGADAGLKKTEDRVAELILDAIKQ